MYYKEPVIAAEKRVEKLRSELEHIHAAETKAFLDDLEQEQKCLINSKCGEWKRH
jgi:hypothetical protein